MTAQATYYIIRALVALVAIPFHEAGHALAAWLLGDATAKREGRLSLNPFAHFDLLGTLVHGVCGRGLGKACVHQSPQLQKPQVGHGAYGAGRPCGKPCAGLPWHGGMEGDVLLGTGQ